MSTIKRGMASVMVAAIAVATNFSTAFADPTITYGKWLEDIKYSGDLRIRHEMFHKKTAGQTDRARERFRLRLNADFYLPYKFAVRTTLASGTGEQVSTNQSFDGLSSQKSIFIDKAYVVWQPLDVLRLQAGRMENPIWRQYSSDAVWDADFNPEGFSQSYSQLIGPFNVFVNALQMVVDEDSGTNNTEGINTTAPTTRSAPSDQRDQWMLGEQVGVEVRLPLESRLKVAFANYNWINERYGDFGANANNEGNRRSVVSSTGALVNNFNVNEFTGVLSSWIFRTPVQIQGTYVVNNGARGTFNPKEDTGWQVGGIVGKAGKAHGWEVAYFRKHVRTDATVADVADSDFGDGGTNREGNIFWVAYSPVEWIIIQAKHFQTEVINVALAPGRDDINRTQFDVSFKF